MSQNTKRVLALGGASVALGAILSLVLAGDKEPAQKEAAVRQPGAVRLAERLKEINNADSVPENQKQAENYNEERWGDVIGVPQTLPQVGSGGERRYQMSKVVVGLARGGKPIYGRMFAQINPERFTLVDKDTPVKVGPTIKAKDFKPGPIWSRLQDLNKGVNKPGNKPPGNLGPAPGGNGKLKNSDESNN